jgi:hypothetical protein
MDICFFAIPITSTTYMCWWFGNFDMGDEAHTAPITYP